MTSVHRDQAALQNVRILIGLAVAGVVVAITSGLIVLIASPESGSTAEAVLGVTAAIAGLATAVFTIAAAIYAQVKNLWQYAPMWLRAATWVFIAIGIATTVWGWIT